jgi:hypothetical protein
VSSPEAVSLAAVVMLPLATLGAVILEW